MMPSFLAGRTAASLGREKYNLQQTAQLERLQTLTQLPLPWRLGPDLDTEGLNQKCS